jgi:hypothetical protein
MKGSNKFIKAFRIYLACNSIHVNEYVLYWSNLYNYFGVCHMSDGRIINSSDFTIYVFDSIQLRSKFHKKFMEENRIPIIQDVNKFLKP